MVLALRSGDDPFSYVDLMDLAVSTIYSNARGVNVPCRNFSVGPVVDLMKDYSDVSISLSLVRRGTSNRGWSCDWNNFFLRRGGYLSLSSCFSKGSVRLCSCLGSGGQEKGLIK